MNIRIRREEKKDWYEVEALTRKAFWRVEKAQQTGIGCDEHYLVHTLRKSHDAVPELNFVAEFNGMIVGHIIYSKAHVRLTRGGCHAVLNFGPISVLPEYQNQGVGGSLMKYSLREATRLGFGAIIFFGHPTYYPRFGFKEAKEFGITTVTGENYPAFMAIELILGDLEGVIGRYIESPLYNVNIEKAIEYDTHFAS